jgi:hypothetical protein
MPESFGTAAGRSSHIDRTDIARRMLRVADAAKADVGEMEIEENKAHPNQRWKIDARWVTFECGCVAERCPILYGAKPFDPVIFRGLPQQAVYEQVCHAHAAGMNNYVHFGRFADFAQWKRTRRNVIMGRARA